MQKDISLEGIDEVMNRAWKAFLIFRNATIRERANFMKLVATRLENSGDELIQIAMRE